MLKNNILFLCVLLLMTLALGSSLSFFPKEKVNYEVYHRQNFEIPKNELIAKKEKTLKSLELEAQILLTEIKNYHGK